MTPRLKSYLERASRIVDRALAKFLPRENVAPSTLHKAMRYSIFAGGKRLRPALVMAGAEICGGNPQRVLPTACALELIHTYSLVHDDLPAMDDDDLRRGKPTSHVVFGEDIAILTGDALLTQAFRLIALNGRMKGISPAAVNDVIGLVAEGAGSQGMIGGQVADILSDQGRWMKLRSSEFAKASQRTIPGVASKLKTAAGLLSFIHTHKTADLLIASLLSGARLAGGTPRQMEALRQYGHQIGLLFQVTDDILDIVGDKKKLGKRGSDAKNRKLTYPALVGLGASQRIAVRLAAEAKKPLKVFSSKKAVLTDLADYILARDH